MDFLIPRPNAGLWPVEAKASKTVRPVMAAPLLSLQRALGDRFRGDAQRPVGNRSCREGGEEHKSRRGPSGARTAPSTAVRNRAHRHRRYGAASGTLILPLFDWPIGMVAISGSWDAYSPNNSDLECAIRSLEPVTVRWSLSRNSKSGRGIVLSPTVKQPAWSQK